MSFTHLAPLFPGQPKLFFSRDYPYNSGIPLNYSGGRSRVVSHATSSTLTWESSSWVYDHRKLLGLRAVIAQF